MLPCKPVVFTGIYDYVTKHFQDYFTRTKRFVANYLALHAHSKLNNVARGLAYDDCICSRSQLASWGYTSISSRRQDYKRHQQLLQCTLLGAASCSFRKMIAGTCANQTSVLYTDPILWLLDFYITSFGAVYYSPSLICPPSPSRQATPCARISQPIQREFRRSTIWEGNASTKLEPRHTTYTQLRPCSFPSINHIHRDR